MKGSVPVRAALLGWSSVPLCVMLMGVSPTLAQQAQTAADADTEVALDEIVVTAQKRREALQDVPISIAALTDLELERRGTRSLRDIQFAVPNLTLYSRADFNPNFIIRGISSSARNIGFESSLGVYVDGVFMGRTSGFNQELDDIERIEVLRGPQGTLFGKNTISGALNMVTKRPGNELEGRVAAEYGNYDYVRASGYVSGPLVSDKLYAKVSAFSVDRHGFVRNVAPSGARRLDDEDSYGVRGELRATPADTIDLALRFDWSRANRHVLDNEVSEILDNPLGLPLVGAVPGARTVAVNGDNREQRTLKGASFTATVALPSGHDIVSISALRKLDYTVNGIDLDAEPSSLLSAFYDDGLKQFTQEVRIASPVENRFNYVAGVYYFDQDSDTSRGIAPGDDLKALLELAFGVPPALVTNLRNFGEVNTRSVAVFANLNFKITEALELTAGARYNDERKKLRFGQEGIEVLGLPSVPANRDRIDDDDFTPTVGMNFEPSDDVMLYARYSRGFKSGGWNADVLSSSSLDDIRFAPESIDSYEIGFKSELLSRRLRLNAALFQLDYSDIQVSRFNETTGRFETTNAAKARSRGFEIEATARPLATLDLSAGIGLADAKYRRYPNAAPGIDLSGVRLDAPRWTVTASAQNIFPLSDSLGLLARADFAYRSRSPGDGLDPRSGVPGFATLDARLGLTSERGWEVSLWARNLTDNDYIVSRFAGGNLGATLGVSQLITSYGSPRTYGVMASLRF